MENLSGTPVTPSQRHGFAVYAHGEITTALFDSQSWGGGGSFSPLKSDISEGKKNVTFQSQMAFTFRKKYSDIFKTARLKKEELLKCSDIPGLQDCLLMGVLVPVETPTAAPCCHVPETIGTFGREPSGSLGIFPHAACATGDAAHGGPKARPSALTLNRMGK